MVLIDMLRTQRVHFVQSVLVTGIKAALCWMNNLQIPSLPRRGKRKGRDGSFMVGFEPGTLRLECQLTYPLL